VDIDGAAVEVALIAKAPLATKILRSQSLHCSPKDGERLSILSGGGGGWSRTR
jgi:hypothetical protein